MEKNKKQRGRKKLSRQYAVMVFAIQMITALILCILVRMECINIYLSAKNDMITDWIRKEMLALNEDEFNPSPSWNLDYWKDHYTKFSSDIDSHDEEFTDEEVENFYDLSYELSCGGEKAENVLNSMSREEQFDFAKFQYYSFLLLFGRASEYYGYEGNSCFIEVGSGKYMVLADFENKINSLIDSICIEENCKSKDRIMAKLRAKTYNDDQLVDFIRLNTVDELGKTHKIYVGKGQQEGDKTSEQDIFLK